MRIEERIDDYLLERELDEAFQMSYNELKSLNIEEQEQVTTPVNEAAVSVTLIISTLLAMPSIIENIAKALGFIYKKIRKLFGKSEEDSKAVEKIIKLSEKWHDSYIAVLRQILRMSGVFKQVGVKNKDTQKKITESVFYLIILGFAVHGGFATYKSINAVVAHAHLGHAKIGVIEGILTHLKAREVKNFISNLISNM